MGPDVSLCELLWVAAEEGLHPKPVLLFDFCHIFCSLACMDIGRAYDSFLEGSSAGNENVPLLFTCKDELI